MLPVFKKQSSRLVDPCALNIESGQGLHWYAPAGLYVFSSHTTQRPSVGLRYDPASQICNAPGNSSVGVVRPVGFGNVKNDRIKM